MAISPLPYPDEFELLQRPEWVEARKQAFNFYKDVIPYIKYIDPSERDRFLELSQQQQTRELLLQNLQAIVELGGGKIIEGGFRGGKALLSPVWRKAFPKSSKHVDDVMEAYTGPIEDYTPPPRPTNPQDLPKYAGSVNLERQKIATHYKLAELRAAEDVPKRGMTWADVDKKSKALLEDPDELSKIMEKAKRGQPLNPIETDVMNKAQVEGLYRFQGAIDSASSVDEANMLFQQFKDELFIPRSRSAEQAGQTLNIYRKEVALNRLGKAYSKMERGLNKRELDAFKKLDMDDPHAVKQFMNDLGDPRLMEYVYEYWYNSILSGIPTHVVNIASNTAWRMFQAPHRALAGAVDAAIDPFIKVWNPGRQRQRYIEEAIPMMGGFIKGKPKALGRGWEMFKKGRITEFETKWAQEMGSTLGAFDRSNSKVVRGVGKVLTVPTKALRTMDVYANSLAYDGQMQALAKRAWIQAGKKGDFRPFMKKFVSEPPEWAHKEAMDFAKYTTFMSDPGKFSSWVMKGRDVTPGGRFVIPFVNTIGNLLKRGVEMTPGVGLALAKNQPTAEVIAKQIEGALIAAMVYQKIEDGEITGAAPQGRAENEAFYRQGKKAWAIKLGDQWVQYRRAEPYNTVIASSTIFHKGIKQSLAEGNEEGATEIFGQMVNEFKNNLIDSSYLQGVSQILNRHGSFKSTPQRVGSSLIPFSGFWRSMNRSYEAAVEGSAKYRPGDTWVSAFANVIPGLYNLTTPKVDVWGKEIELEGGVFRQWLPYKWSTAKGDKTELFLEKIDRYPGLPSQVVTYNNKKVRLDDDIYRNMLIYGGNRAKARMDKRVAGVWGSAADNPKHHERLRKDVDNLLDAEWRRAKRRAIREQLKRGIK